MSKKAALYNGYTLAEVLVVLMIVIILGGVGAYSFGGLRDSILVKQNIEGIKQDLQLIQQKTMLLEKKEREGWIYGIGVDFSRIHEGKYTFFKWCSPFSSYGDIRTRSEILAHDPSDDIGTTTPYGPNAALPLNEWDTSGLCTRDTIIPISSYLTPMPGLEDGQINMGFNMGLISSATYLVYESVTGRAFLYDSSGMPVNFTKEGQYIPDRLLGITIFRNRGDIADLLQISPLSGSVSHEVIQDSETLNRLRQEVLIPESEDENIINQDILEDDVGGLLYIQLLSSKEKIDLNMPSQ